MNNWYSFIRKILTFPNFFLLNLLIIVVVEASGDFFYRTGLIHFLAVIYVILALAVVFRHRYYIADPISERFLTASVYALIIFSLAHVLEFFSLEILKISEPVVFVNVVNVCAISILVLVIGVEYIHRSLYKSSSFYINFLWSTLFVLVVAIPLFIGKPNLVSLESRSYFPYIYSLILAIVAGFGLLRIQIAKRITILKRFVNFLSIGIILILVAGLIHIFHYFLVEKGLPHYQVIYLMHFAFFIALSYLFTAFESLSQVKGLYKEIETKLNR